MVPHDDLVTIEVLIPTPHRLGHHPKCDPIWRTWSYPNDSGAHHVGGNRLSGYWLRRCSGSITSKPGGWCAITMRWPIGDTSATST